MPFQFMNQLLQEGMRAAVSCQVLQGDTPIDFVWEFEGQPILLPTTRVSSHLTLFSSSFSLDSV